MGLRFLGGLPGFLRRPLDLAAARAILRRRLERRPDDFLDLMRRTVFANAKSPYGRLMRHAGCAYGDLDRQVRRDGLEGALGELLRAGVYLTLDEYQGRKPVVRGGLTLAVEPAELRNPLATPRYLAATSGSRGPATQIPLDLACVRDRAVNLYLGLAARGGERWRNAVWGVPGIGPVLWYSLCGGPVAKWFSAIDPDGAGLPARSRWNARAIAWTSRLAGVRMPQPEYAATDAPSPIIRWMEQTLRSGETPHLWGSSSPIVNLCRLARASGVSLAGAQLTITGEPVTDARLAAIREVGATALPDYGSADSGGSASGGCLHPEAADDVHLWTDLNALIQTDAPPFPRGALLLTSIRPTSPFVFLNVSMGDRATMLERSCGCPMEDLGWKTHLHTIRSYEKLTAGGATFEDGEVVRILEEVLPRRFGGGPTDYQLVEEVTDDGQPKVRLLVHPRVGELDPATVASAFLDALAGPSVPRQLMAGQWRAGGYLGIERRAPLATTSGKIHHVWTRPAISTEEPG
jgi:hypothetical protein